MPVGIRQTLGKTQEDLREETRTMILTSARELFEEIGYPHTSMQMIAARAMISRSSIYRHFETKNDIAQALVENFWPEWREMWKDCPFDEDTSVAKLAEWLKKMLTRLNTSKSFVFVAHAVEEIEEESTAILSFIGQHSGFRPAKKQKSEAYFFDHIFVMQLNKFFYSSIKDKKYFRDNDIAIKAMARHMMLFLEGRRVYTAN